MSADPRRVPGVERIAVRRANALGDLMFVLPALEALDAAYPEAEIVLLAADWHRDLLAARPGPVDRVIPLPPSEGVRGDALPVPPEELERFFERMRAEQFDLALQVHGGGRFSNPFVRRLGARLTAGLQAPDAEPLDRSVPYIYYQHEVIRYLEVAALVGAPPVHLEPRFPVTDDDRAAAAPVLTGAAPLVVLHPGATDSRRRWPAADFAAVGDALAGDGARVVVTGTPSERALVDEVLEAMRAAGESLCGRLSLPGLVGLLEAADLVVTNDTGPMHVAAAVGTRTVGVFWVGNMINGAQLTRGRHRPQIAFRLACPVCGVDCTTGSCEHRESFVADVPVGDVVDAARSLLATAATPAAAGR